MLFRSGAGATQALRKRELSRTFIEQQTERAHLEQLDEVLVARQDALDGREIKLHAEADARLVKKRDALEAEFSQKAKDIRAQERGTFTEKLKVLEARQADKVHGLKKELDFSKQEAQRLREECNSAREEADAAREERGSALAELE